MESTRGPSDPIRSGPIKLAPIKKGAGNCVGSVLPSGVWRNHSNMPTVCKAKANPTRSVLFRLSSTSCWPCCSLQTCFNRTLKGNRRTNKPTNRHSLATGPFKCSTPITSNRIASGNGAPCRSCFCTVTNGPNEPFTAPLRST